MNKLLAVVLVAGTALLITGSTYWIQTDDMRYNCVSEDFVATDSIYTDTTVETQIQRGFPVWFYKSAVPPSCDVSYDENTYLAVMGSGQPVQFRLFAVLLNLLIWTTLLATLVWTGFKIRKESSDNQFKASVLSGSYLLLLLPVGLFIVYAVSKEGFWVAFGNILLMIIALLPWLIGSALALVISFAVSKFNKLISRSFFLLSLLINAIGAMALFAAWGESVL